jgi:DNA-directed RNA polymerase specialized sigma24 family protein
MPSTASVTEWISRLQAGDQAAAQLLWERYFQRLIGLARKNLQAAPRRAADEEDVALSAFATFCRGAVGGRFPRLHDREDLWPLLVVITARKAFDLIARERRQKRGGGAVVHEGALPDARGPSGLPAFEELLGREPTPAFAAQVAEEFQRLLTRLGDASLQTVALLKMQGYNIKEIALQLDCVPRTVRRRLSTIRSLWAEEAAS